ncbi:hypothetical protein AGR4C_pc30011 [Agrobacterium tumefaciens str. Kerr 14]|uniref:Uncharacterized protein n=1 Tax=Agrobacterium tumefaciens str. Kerr 14 TaxID=1183424 RepID=A0A1S7SG16_AGRTU|nr:hypothetical protein AGR4C_pc30011 [Agrobacterium tumefaciens str. Kerr 14]
MFVSRICKTWKTVHFDKTGGDPGLLDTLLRLDDHFHPDAPAAAAMLHGHDHAARAYHNNFESSPMTERKGNRHRHSPKGSVK